MMPGGRQFPPGIMASAEQDQNMRTTSIVRCPGWLSRDLPLLVALVLGLLARPAGAGPGETPGLDFDDFRIEDWAALGSGCRAIKGQPANVFIAVERDLKIKSRYQIRFDLSSYELSGTDPVQPDTPTFARECGIRVAIYPKKGKKVSAVESRATFTGKKPRDVRVLLKGRMFLGYRDLATWARTFGEEVHWSGEESIVLKPDAEGKKVFPEIRCEQPKLVGLDLSISNFRKDFEHPIQVGLKNRQAVITVEVASCPPPS